MYLQTTGNKSNDNVEYMRAYYGISAVYKGIAAIWACPALNEVVNTYNDTQTDNAREKLY